MEEYEKLTEKAGHWFSAGYVLMVVGSFFWDWRAGVFTLGLQAVSLGVFYLLAALELDGGE